MSLFTAFAAVSNQRLAASFWRLLFRRLLSLKGAGNGEKGFAGIAVRRLGGHRMPGISGLSNFREKRNVAEKGNALAPGFFLAAAASKNVDALALRRGEVAHVFHDSENGNVHFAEHGDAFSNDAERGLLGRGDDDSAVKRHGLAEGQLRVSGSGRKVDEQEVQLAPLDAGDELLDGFDNHGAAPDDGLIIFQQETHAHEFDAVIFRRNKFFVGAEAGPLADAHHQGNAGAVNVAVQKADFEAKPGQSAGKVGGESGFADAAFAAGNGDDLPNFGNLIGRRRRSIGNGRARALRGSNVDVNLSNFRQVADLRFGLRFDFLRRFRASAGKFDHDRYGAVLRRNVSDQSKRDNIPRISGILYLSKRLFDAFGSHAVCVKAKAIRKGCRRRIQELF